MLSTLCVGTFGCLAAYEPMPQRLSPEGQTQVDEGWSRVVAAREKVDRQLLLDTIILEQLWHSGVDRLDLTVEKDVGDATVRMVTHFRREKPEADRFTVTYLDRAGSILREESFTREEIHRTAEELMIDPMTAPPIIDGDPTPEQLAQAKAAQARQRERIARVQSVFSMDALQDGNAPEINRTELPTDEAKSH